MYPLHVRIITCRKKTLVVKMFFSERVEGLESNSNECCYLRIVPTVHKIAIYFNYTGYTLGQVRSVGVTGRGWGGPLTWLRNLSGDIGKHSKIYNPGTHKCWSFSSCLWMYIGGSCTSPRDRLYVNACVQRVFTCTDHPLSLFAGRYWPLA